MDNHNNGNSDVMNNANNNLLKVNNLQARIHVLEAQLVRVGAAEVLVDLNENTLVYHQSNLHRQWSTSRIKFSYRHQTSDSLYSTPITHNCGSM